MAGPLDFIGNLVQGAEQGIGGFLQGMFPGQTPSAPARPSQPPLPSPQANPRQNNQQQNWSLLASDPGRFAQNVGLTQLGSNFASSDATNKDTMAGQFADPNSPVSQVQKFTADNPVSKVAKYVANVLNAGVVDPVRLAADPQMWFAEDNNPHPVMGPNMDPYTASLQTNMPGGSSPGHNYLRDVFSPIVKQITGEDVPHTVAWYQNQAQTMTQEGQQLETVSSQLTPQSSQAQIDAYNAKLAEYQSRVAQYDQGYQKSQDWWTNSPTSKTLSVLGQIATFPGGFASGAVAFVPQLIADPIGTGESMISQVQMGADFVGKLMNKDTRDHMSSQELAANIGNIAMLAGMLYGAKKTPGTTAKLIAGKNPFKDTSLGRKPDPALLARVQSELHQHDPEHRNPEPAPTVANPPVDPNAPRSEQQAHLDQRALDAAAIREKMQTTSNVEDRAVLQKQLNDITDEVANIKAQPKPKPLDYRAIQDDVADNYFTRPGARGTIIQTLSNEDLIRAGRQAEDLQDIAVLDALDTEARNRGGWEKIYFPEGMDNSPLEAGTGFGGRAFDSIPEGTQDAFEAKRVQDVAAEQAVNDAGREMQTEQRPQYTAPVYPKTGFADSKVDTLLKDLSDFTRPAIMQEAIRKNPQDYASPSARPTTEGPVPVITPAILRDVVNERNWKSIPATKVEYGWLFPKNKGIELGYTRYANPKNKASIDALAARADHTDLWRSLENVLGQKISPLQWKDLQVQNSWVQLRRGLNEDRNDYQFWVPEWNDTVKGIVNDYLLSRRNQPELPKYITIDIAPDLGAGTGRRTLGDFSWEEFANNNFNIDTLVNEIYRPAELFSKADATPQAMGPWLYDRFTDLRKSQNQINFLEDRIDRNGTKGFNTTKDEAALRQTLDKVQKSLSELPYEVPDIIIDLRNQLEDKLNEKGYPTTAQTGTEGAASQASKRLDTPPPSAPKGSALAAIVSGPKGEGEVAIWTPDPQSTRGLSQLERGRVELNKTLNKTIQELTTDYGEVASLAKLEANPVNYARREQELISTFKTQVDGIDPSGYAPISHFVIDPTLETDALYNPSTRSISVNPYKAVITRWAQNAAGNVQRGLNAVKSLIPDEGKAVALRWIEAYKNLNQSQLDFRLIAEEVFHKLDIDHFSNLEYLDALGRLPWEWWNHAGRSGLGDRIEGGLVSKDNEGEFNLQTKGGQTVGSWLDAYYAAKNNLLDQRSFVATMTTFMEYRVNQLLNYHGVPGFKDKQGNNIGFTYRVPEVMYRELQDPKLIDEGARIAGDNFQEYVRKETAPRLSLRKAYEEEATANALQTNAGVPTMATTPTDATLPTTAPIGSNGRNAGDQTGVNPQSKTTEGSQDFPQVGDILQINVGTNKKPKWVQFLNRPFENSTDIQQAAQIVSDQLVPGEKSRGKNEPFIPTEKQPGILEKRYRIVDSTGKERVFQGLPPSPEETPQFVPGGTTDTPDVRENPETFHGIPTPNIEPLDPRVTGRTQQENLRKQVDPNAVAKTGFSKKALGLTDTVTPEIPDAIGKGYRETIDKGNKLVGQTFSYRPIMELGRTGYPGTWEDFLASMASPEDSIAFRTAKPYWDKLEPKYQAAFQEAMKSPGVEQAMLDREENPTIDAAKPEDINSPAFQARQQKIQQYHQDIADSGATLDRMSRTVTSSEGLKKYNNLKAMTAAKVKYVELGPGVPEKEAVQLMGQEFTRVKNELETKKQSATLPDQLKLQPSTADLIDKLQPVLRAYLENKVSIKDTTGKLAKGYYRTLEQFVDAYTAREPDAVKIYDKLQKTSKAAIRGITDQKPQALSLPRKMQQPDQTIIPSSQQGAQEHINPTSPEDMRAIVESNPKIIARHGSTPNNEQGLTRGHSNPPLSSLGRLQARNLARAFRGMKNLKIVTHDLDRASDTATAIARMARGSKVTVDPNGRPWNVGTALTGLASITANPRMLKMMTEAPDYVPEGGESFNQFIARQVDFFRQHIYTTDTFVLSTRSMRFLEDWIQQGMPDAANFEPGAAMTTIREVGPGGIMAIGNAPDGQYTVNAKISQMPASGKDINVPKVESTISQGSETVNVKGYQKPTESVTVPRSQSPVTDNVVDQATMERNQFNIKIGEQATKEAAAIKGEIAQPISLKYGDRVDAIVADPSIAATDPFKMAAVKAKLAKDGASYAKSVGAPQEAVDAQVKEYNIQIGKLTDLAAEKAKDQAKSAVSEVKPPLNLMVHDTSLQKAQEHFNRVAAGNDWHESAARAASEMGMFGKKDPFAGAMARIRDAGMHLLPSDHEAYSLSEAFKDVFIDPKAVELVKNEKLSEPPHQGLLPVPTEKLLGVDTPVPAPINEGKKATGTRKTTTSKPKNPAPPAIAENLAARTPSANLPEPVLASELPKNYKISIGEHDNLKTTDLTEQTKQINEAINTEVPSLMGKDVEQQLVEEGEKVFDKATRGKPPMPDDTGGGGGKKPPLPPDHYKGWDDARNYGDSFGGNVSFLSRRLDYGLKIMGKIHNPGASLAHPTQMARSFGQARVESIMVGDDIKTILEKLFPAAKDKNGEFTNPQELARHQAMARAIGGGNEERRLKALNELSAQDLAIANMLHHYHNVMGSLGMRPESHMWDAAQDDYFPRRILTDENGKKPVTDVHGNTQYSAKMSIARERRKRQVTKLDDNGNERLYTENYYLDNEDLKQAGFKVEEDIGRLWGYHWDAFSNMNIAHQMRSYLSGPDMMAFREPTLKAGQRGIPKGSEQYVGRIIVPRTTGGKATQIDPKYRGQLDTVNKGPWTRFLANDLVYAPVKEELERMATVRSTDSFGDRLMNGVAEANGVYKVFKFAFNVLHMGNLLSNIYALGTKGLLDPALVNIGGKWKGKVTPGYESSLHHRVFGRVDALLSDEATYKDWNGQPILGRDMVAKLMSWGAVLPKEIIDVASLGGITGKLARNVPGFREWHNVMWHEVAWKAHIGLSLHLLDVMRSELAKPGAIGHELNEAEFENAGRLAVALAKHAMGFITKEEMTRDWAVYANALFLANSWSLSQARFLGQAIPKIVPGAKYMANLGGGETYNDVITEQMRTMGGMSQKSLDAINGQQGKIARRLMLGGAAKLLAMSTIMTYIGSQLATGQSSGPYQNFQRDPTHTFDVYLGTDQITGKDRWMHNPLFGMQQEILLYGLQAVKDYESGGNPYDMFMSVAGRISNKANPILSTGVDLLVNRNLSLYLQGYGDRSDISADPNIIAIRRALDATGKNPFPGAGWENNLLYAVRQLFPSPGFPDTLNTKNGTAPAMTNATLGNVLNALGPGKVAGLGDLVNAVQSGDYSTLAKKDLGGLAMWLTGSSVRTSSTPEAIATQNQIQSSLATRDQKNQALNDLSHAAQTGDWKTVAQIAQELQLTNSQLVQALEHPVSGGGPGVLYAGLPARNQSAPAPQDTLNGVELTPAQTTELESLKEANTIAMIKQVTGLAEFKSADNTNRTAMMAAYISLINTLSQDQYAQKIGLLGGTPITNADIQATLNTAIEYRGEAQQVLSGMDLYIQADALTRQRMETTFGSYAITLARDSIAGNLKGVPLENVRQMLAYTIQVEETTRAALENSMFFQLAAPGDQTRMYNEYSALAREVAKREALQQGQGSYAFRIPPDKMIPTIEFIINVEESGKAALHGTDYYAAADPTQQKALDTKYETIARGLGFSTSGADPRVLIQNSIRADQAYYDLQNQFGGNSYIKLMAQQLADMERSARVSAQYSPRQIAAMERSIRAQFLAQNPAYAAWLKTLTSWQKNTTDGQMYAALNNSEYAAVADMQAAGVVQSNSLLLAGGSTDYSIMDPGTQLGLPPQDYNTFAANNP